jgi:hypothetical protein
MTAMLKLTGLLCALVASVPLHAMPYHAPETWGGDLTSGNFKDLNTTYITGVRVGIRF